MNFVIDNDTKKDEKKLITNIKKKLGDAPDIINCELDELEYIKKPVGKSIYQRASEEKKTRKKKWNGKERLVCDLCGGEFVRSHKSDHEKTKYHITYKIVNDKFKQLMLN